MINNYPFFRFPFYRYSPNPWINKKHNFNNVNYSGHNNSHISPSSNNDFLTIDKNFTNINNNLNNSKNHLLTIDKNFTNINNNLNNSKNDLLTTSDECIDKRKSKYNSVNPFFINSQGFYNINEPLIEFSGLKLYLDDLIILSILFFLYKENVKDNMLFIILILLLLS